MDKELVVLNEGKATTTSRHVAEVFGKRHDVVLRDIKTQLEKIRSTNLWSESGGQYLDHEFFHEETYEVRGRKYPMYRMNKNGFVLLVMSYTDEKSMTFKIRYIHAFDEMEHTIQTQAQLNGLLMIESEADMRRERESKNKRNEAIWMNAITKQTRMYLDTAERVNDLELRQALINKAGRQLLSE